MSVISRYVFREALGSILVVVLVLFVILMSNQFAEILGDAAADELPRDAVFAVFRLNSLWYLTALLPISLFLGIMLALARLNRDSETAALWACGIGPGELFRPIAFLAVLLAAACAWLSLVKSPEAALNIEQIRFAAEAELESTAFVPGRFHAADSGGAVLHFEQVDADTLERVFWHNNGDGEVTIVLAEEGLLPRNGANGERSFTLRSGRLYRGTPGELDWDEIEFEEQFIPVEEEEREEFVVTAELKSLQALLASSDPLDAAELQWRISAPVSILLLALLAVPLSRSSPREGRYARLGVGMLIYVIYSNLQSLGRVWIERGDVPPWIGLWWVHVGLGLFALIMFGRVSGWFSRPGPVPAAAAA